MNYDSKPDTLEHIYKVRRYLREAAKTLQLRAIRHDLSKLKSPEKEAFDQYTPKLQKTTYGSKEYKELLKQLKPALEHHYKNNSHHPEHYPEGINDMDLFDIIEMFFDWKAASERHEDGDIYKSIAHNQSRFDMTDQLRLIFENTARNLNWEK
jgi:hypothetical protein